MSFFKEYACRMRSKGTDDDNFLTERRIPCRRILLLFGLEIRKRPDSKGKFSLLTSTFRWILIIVYFVIMLIVTVTLLTDYLSFMESFLFLGEEKVWIRMNKIKVLTNLIGASFTLISFKTKTYENAMLLTANAWRSFSLLSKANLENKADGKHGRLCLCTNLAICIIVVSWIHDFICIYHHRIEGNFYFALVVFALRKSNDTLAILILVATISEFITLCDTVQLSFEHIQKDVIKVSKGAKPPSEAKLRSLRLMHSYATEMVQGANEFWKYFLFVFYLFVVSFSILEWYMVLFEQMTLQSRAMITVGSIFNTLLLSRLSLKVASVYTSSQDLYHPLYQLTTQFESVTPSPELKLFLQRLLCQNVGFTCWDMFIVTPNILLTVCTAVTTYLLALKSDPFTCIDPAQSAVNLTCTEQSQNCTYLQNYTFTR